MKWYLDLDDTLYRTVYGYGEVCRATSRLYNLQFFSVVMRVLQYHQQFDLDDGPRRSIRLFKALQSYGIDSAEAEALLIKELRNKELLYPDAILFLDWLEKKGIKPTILTFGDPATQLLKQSLVPRLRDLECVVVQEPKQNYLKNLPEHDAILVDDRPVDDLPSWCQGVLLTRKANPLYSGRKIASLTELIDE